jgi:putative ABC transport system ATP-binding protein
MNNTITDETLMVQLADVYKVYRMGSTEVYGLRGIDLTIRAGEMVAVLGPSASGKSTLLNILGCLDTPTSGRYVLDGTLVKGMSKDALADIRNRKLGFFFQGFNLLPRTSALRNVELPLLYDRTGRWRNTRQLAVQALERVGLGARIDRLPSDLSSGQQQRVAIARALVTRPALLLADEPTGNLDTHTAMEIMALLRELNTAGTSVLIVTHDWDIAHCASRIIEIRDGRMLRDQPVATPRREAVA